MGAHVGPCITAFDDRCFDVREGSGDHVELCFRFAERYGADIELERLLEILAADCRYMRPAEKARKYEERCGVRFTDLDGARPPHDRPPALVVPILKVVRR